MKLYVLQNTWFGGEGYGFVLDRNKEILRFL